MSQESESNLEKVSLEYTLIYPQELDSRGPVNLDDGPQDLDPIGKALEELSLDRLLTKRESQVDPLTDVLVDEDLLVDEDEESEDEDDDEDGELAKLARAEKHEKAVGFYLRWVEQQMVKTRRNAREIVSGWKQEFPDAAPDIESAIEEAVEILAA